MKRAILKTSLWAFGSFFFAGVIFGDKLGIYDRMSGTEVRTACSMYHIRHAIHLEHLNGPNDSLWTPMQAHRIATRVPVLPASWCISGFRFNTDWIGVRPSFFFLLFFSLRGGGGGVGLGLGPFLFFYLLGVLCVPLLILRLWFPPFKGGLYTQTGKGWGGSVVLICFGHIVCLPLWSLPLHHISRQNSNPNPWIMFRPPSAS